MAIIMCPECGKEVSDKAYKCPQCGKQLREMTMPKKYCLECGQVLNEADTMCPKCGCPVDKNNEYNLNDKISNKRKPQKIKNIGTRKIVGCATVLIVLIGIIIYISSDYRKYNTAKGNYEKGNYSEAAEGFKKLDDYKDSKELYLKAEHQAAVMNDKVPPTILMNSKSIDLKQGEGFNESEWITNNKVTANDNVSDTIILKVDTSELDVSKAGEYKLTVYAEDEAGNKQSEEVIVNVKKIYTQEELEKAVKATFEADIPGLDRIEYNEPTVWVYLVQDGLAESGVAAKLNTNVKNKWDELMKQFDEMSMMIYSHLLSEGYSDIQSVNVMLLNDLDKSKILYVTVNGTKFKDVTD